MDTYISKRTIENLECQGILSQKIRNGLKDLQVDIMFNELLHASIHFSDIISLEYCTLADAAKTMTLLLLKR